MVPDSPTSTAPPEERICYIISSFHPVVGGAEKATQTLAKALRQRGRDVVVLTRRYDRGSARFELVDGVLVYRLGWPGRGKGSAITFALHVLYLLAWPLRSWRIIHVQNIDTPLLAGMVAKVVLRRKLVATIHGQTQIQGRNMNTRGRLRTRAMARMVDAFTSINPENTAELLANGVASTRVWEIPNGVDTDVFRRPSDAERAAARAELGLGPDEFVVVYVGRLVGWKRVDLLIDAWGRLDRDGPRRLVVVGAGPTAESLQSSAARLGDSVRFDGATSRPTTYLWAADVFANASGDNQLQGEGLSVALLEAMAAGVPPVVTSGPGNDVVVEDNVTGLSFPVMDVEALGARLRALHDDPDLRARLGRNAEERVRRRYSSDAVAEQVERLYASVADTDAR